MCKFPYLFGFNRLYLIDRYNPSLSTKRKVRIHLMFKRC